MFDPTSLPYLRAAVCFLEDRLSQLLPSRLGAIEFTVPEQILPEFERIAEQNLPRTWATWTLYPRPSLIATILQVFPSLAQVMKLLTFIQGQASRRKDRGGPFEAFAVLAVDGLIRQPWLRSGRLTVGSWWRDAVKDANRNDIRDAAGNTNVRCWIEDVEPYPAQLMAHLMELVCEMETIGEQKKSLLEELGIDPRYIDLQELASLALVEEENVDEPSHTVQMLASSTKIAMTTPNLPAHIVTYRDAINEGKTPSQATEIANRLHNKSLLRKSYTDMLTRHTRPITRAA